MEGKPHTILVCDDDPRLTYAVRMVLEHDGHRVITAHDGEECLASLQAESPDLAFLDISMPVASGLWVLEQAKELAIGVPIIMITGYGTMETAIQAMHLGAYDYVTKPLDMEKIRILTQRVLETRRLKEELLGLRRRLGAAKSPDASDLEADPDAILGKSPAMLEVFKKIGIVSATPPGTSVLIRGESGTGKELVARAIHRNSAAAAAPFVTINCTAVPADLLENELFGHERGAFTGAVEPRPGKLEIAGEGTAFFDEIGDLAVPLQQKLLRLLQEREFERIGGHRPIPVNARFIFATHRDLEEEVQRGTFREDLFFRINVVPIFLPPLRQRKEDIPLLIDHFIHKHNRKLGRRVQGLSGDALQALMQHDYAGNVRELANILERTMTLGSGEVLTLETVQEALPGARSGTSDGTPITSSHFDRARRDAVQAFEKRFLRELLAATQGNVEEAARQARLRRQSFYRLLKKHGISPKEFKKPLSPGR